MPGTPRTPIYGWPYLNRYTDRLTYEALSGEDALLAAEETVSGVDARLAAVEAVATELGDAWTPYVPAWTSITATNPTAASHSVTGRWKKIDSKLAIVEFRIVGLTTTGWGSGVYGIGLPWAITSTSRDMSSGAGRVDDPGVFEWPCVVSPFSTTVLRMHYAPNGNVGATLPVALSTNDVLRGSIMVEPA